MLFIDTDDKTAKMNFVHTEENFTDLDPKDKMNLVKELSNAPHEPETPELSINVFVDNEGKHSLEPNGEAIDLNVWDTIEKYLHAKYPLSNIAIHEVKVDELPGDSSDEVKAA